MICGKLARRTTVLAASVGTVLVGTFCLAAPAALAAGDDQHDPGVRACREQVRKNERVVYDYMYAGCDPTRYDNRGDNGNSSKVVNGHPDERRPIGQGLINGIF